MKHTEEIMRLADAYAEQMRRSGAGQLVDAARAALEAALSAKQGEQEAVPLTEYQKLQALVTSQGIRLMEYESAPEAKQEPVGKFAKFTDGVWREVTDGSPGVFLYELENTK